MPFDFYGAFVQREKIPHQLAHKMAQNTQKRAAQNTANVFNNLMRFVKNISLHPKAIMIYLLWC